MGGGWSFQNNLAKGFEHTEDSDIYFITSPSIVQRAEVVQAKSQGKKIVLRLDNVIRNSRNRNTGMSRMKDFCELADLVIYQSEWAKKFLMPFTKTDGPVILNGVDTSIFTPSDKPEGTYLYVRSSRDEGKQWIMAWYWMVNRPGKLEIVGKFSPENLEYNFDFYNGEDYTFSGQQTDMPSVYRRNKYFLYTYLNDAMSNTAIEALCSGCEIIDVNGMAKTGGMPEIMAKWETSGRDYFSTDRMCQEYGKAMEILL